MCSASNNAVGKDIQLRHKLTQSLKIESTQKRDGDFTIYLIDVMHQHDLAHHFQVVAIVTFLTREVTQILTAIKELDTIA